MTVHARPVSARCRRIACRRQRRILFVLMLIAGFVLGFVSVLEPAWPLELLAAHGPQTVAVAVIGGLAMYFYTLPEDRPVHWRTATVKAVTGGVWGFIGAKLGAGAGMSESMQTGIAGVLGAKGPDLYERLVDTALDKRKS